MFWRPDRRDVLRLFLGTGVAAALGPGSAGAARPATATRLFPTSGRDAALVGAACRRGLGGSAARDAFRTLCPTGTDEAAFAAASDERARRWFAGAVARDYEQGRTVRVDGWLLSEREAAALMLVAAEG